MNRMEVPQDYNSNDSFYQDKLLQSIGINGSINRLPLEDTKNYIISSRKIDEEDIEESLEGLTGKKKYIGAKKKSKTNSELLTDNSNSKTYSNFEKVVGNKENKAFSYASHSSSRHSSQNHDYEAYQSPYDRYNNLLERGKEMLTITVEIGNGQKENIIIYENDDAQYISDSFWKKHNINDELKIIFTNQIAENINQVKEEIANELAESKFASAPHLDNYRDISPSSIENLTFSEVV
jgi:hypothetical protein